MTRRILVMRDGTIVGELAREAFSQTTLMAFIARLTAPP